MSVLQSLKMPGVSACCLDRAIREVDHASDSYLQGQTMNHTQHKTLSMMALLLLACSATSAAARDCDINFSVEGSFFAGKSFKTWQEHSGVSYDNAFRSVAQAVSSAGFAGVSPNKDLGIISAGQAVTLGQGAVAPLNVVVKNQGKRVRVEAHFRITGGQMASEEAARTQLCKLVEAPQG